MVLKFSNLERKELTHQAEVWVITYTYHTIHLCGYIYFRLNINANLAALSIKDPHGEIT